MKIAIIGSGISGLSSALLLSQKHNITLFESNDRFGGHANTVEIMHKQNVIPVDTGFIVYNKLNYPNLIAFFDFLNKALLTSPSNNNFIGSSSASLIATKNPTDSFPSITL